MSTLNDHELTVLVEAAASGAVNSRAAHHGGPDWEQLDAGDKNAVREHALPFIHHGTKALDELGYSKPRVITTRDEANALPDRSAFITPGEIIFRKWENYYAEGQHAWERELGQFVPAELLSEMGHFPGVVLHVGGAS